MGNADFTEEGRFHHTPPTRLREPPSSEVPNSQASSVHEMQQHVDDFTADDWNFMRENEISIETYQKFMPVYRDSSGTVDYIGITRCLKQIQSSVLKKQPKEK